MIQQRECFVSQSSHITLLSCLLDNSEVRRAAMCNLDLHPTTLPYILSRSRDVDPINRRVIYAQSLAELPNMAVLSPEQRNIIAKSGLRDREDSVRKSAAKLIGKWAGNMEGGLLEVCRFHAP